MTRFMKRRITKIREMFANVCNSFAIVRKVFLHNTIYDSPTKFGYIHWLGFGILALPNLSPHNHRKYFFFFIAYRELTLNYVKVFFRAGIAEIVRVIVIVN